MKIHKLKLRNLSFIFLSISLFVAVNINAQVTIGSNYAPDGNALLDLKRVAIILQQKDCSFLG